MTRPSDRNEPKTEIDGSLLPPDSDAEQRLAYATPTVFDPLKSGLYSNEQHPRTSLDAGAANTELYTPRRRTPTAKLVIMDDGSVTDGEVVRVRKERFVIGRKDGDLNIEHDLDISAKHATLKLKSANGRQRWRLEDTNSTNGTFVRVSRAPLPDGKELLLGSDRYRVEIDGGSEPVENQAQQNGGTRLFQVATAQPASVKKLRLISSVYPDHCFEISDRGAKLGTDRSRCDIAIEDPSLSPVHATISWSGTTWRIEDANSLNGVWIRVNSVWLDQNAEFQLGEQRFRFYWNGQTS